MRTFLYDAEKTMLQKEKPDFAVNGTKGWVYISDGFDKENKRTGKKERVGVGTEMILLEMTQQDGETIYEGFALAKCKIWMHNAANIMTGLKGLDASRKAKAEAAKVKAEADLKAATEAIQKTAPTLKAAGGTRAAMVQFFLTQYQNLTADQVEAAVPKD